MKPIIEADSSIKAGVIVDGIILKFASIKSRINLSWKINGLLGSQILRQSEGLKDNVRDLDLRRNAFRELAYEAHN